MLWSVERGPIREFHEIGSRRNRDRSDNGGMGNHSPILSPRNRPHRTLRLRGIPFRSDGRENRDRPRERLRARWTTMTNWEHDPSAVRSRIRWKTS